MTCLKCEGLPYNVTTTPDLPAERVSADPPFTHISIDPAGPFYVKDKLSNTSKVMFAYLFVVNQSTPPGAY